MPDPHPTPGLRRGERRRWLVFTAAMVFMSMLAVLLILVLQANTKSDRSREALARQQTANAILGACNAQWDRLTSERSRIVSKYNSQKELALSVLLGLSPNDPSRPAALKVYRTAQHTLSEELLKYPPPVYTCDASPTAPTPTLTPSPLPVQPSTVTATKSATATRTATATVPGPGSTVTATRVQPEPGRTVTVTHTKTVTKTVSPPSCLTDPIPPCVLDIHR